MHAQPSISGLSQQLISNFLASKTQNLWRECTDVKDHLSLGYPQMQYVPKCHVLGHFYHFCARTENFKQYAISGGIKIASS